MAGLDSVVHRILQVKMKRASSALGEEYRDAEKSAAGNSISYQTLSTKQTTVRKEDTGRTLKDKRCLILLLEYFCISCALALNIN